MRLTIIIPAHNEEAELPATLSALTDASAGACAALPELQIETIVACDGCTDTTSQIATAAGARVTSHERRQIAATRNLGARAASGDVLLFLDADTRIAPANLLELISAINGGAVGGGVPISFEGRVPLYARIMLPMFNAAFRMARLTGGCFFYCRAEVLAKAGGWDETYYASEEVHLAREIKAFGRFEILRTPVRTSGRKLRTFTPWEILGVMLCATMRPKKYLGNRDNLDLWYAPRRADPEHAQQTKVTPASASTAATTDSPANPA